MGRIRLSDSFIGGKGLFIGVLQVINGGQSVQGLPRFVSFRMLF